jgi:hypothetical protein
MNWRDFISDVKRGIRRDEDRLIVVDGKEGSGKSTLALKMAAQFEPAFRPSEGVRFRASDYVDLAAQRRGRVVVLDEAFRGALARRAMSGENVRFVTFLGENRWRNNIQIVNFPNIHFLDPYLRKHRVDWWFHVESRGVATMHRAERMTYTAKVRWVPEGRISFGPETGPVWDEYLGFKEAELVRILAEDDALEDEPEPPDAKPRRDLAVLKERLRRELRHVAARARQDQGQDLRVRADSTG